jgi:hypothetical protein
MNQCIFSPDRIYRYVLRCRCTRSAPENLSLAAFAGHNSEKAQHSNTPVLRSKGVEDSGSTEFAEVLSAVAEGFRCQPLKVGLASEAALQESDVGEGGRTKQPASAKRIAWIGLNPSTADEVTLDRTLSAVCRYSRKWGFTEVVMLNLFAFRATDPRDLKRATDPIGPENDKHLLAEVCNADRVIACWGDHGRFLERDRQVSNLLGVSFECLRRNRTGTPHHPLYLKSRIKPKPFGMDQIRI